jgi:superfamily II DNA or RNA helicase
MDITFDKLDDTIDRLMETGMMEEFSDLDIDKDIEEKLFDYQVVHLHNLVFAAKNHNVVVDGSDTGTGKTYTGIALCKQLKLRPFIICPKTVMSNWNSVCKIFGISPLTIVNYETIKSGKQYNNLKDMKRVETNYLKVEGKRFTWSLPKDSILIFDEVHKCKNKKSINGKLLLSVKKQKKVLLISATLAEKVESFHIYGYLLGFYRSITQANNWIKGIIKEDISSKRKVGTIFKKIFPMYGSRMLVEELGDNFPKSHIASICYTCPNTSKIDKKYKVIESKIGNTGQDSLNEILKARMKIEEYKIPIFKQLAEDYLENGWSVVIFVNYRKTMKKLGEELECKNFLCGGLEGSILEDTVNKFQNNKINLIISTIGMAEGISLHDTSGNHPRATFISPLYSSIKLEQCLGRVQRAGAKSRSVQRIVFCANSYEEDLRDKLEAKLKLSQEITNKNKKVSVKSSMDKKKL